MGESVRAVPVTCSRCGAALDPPAGTRFVTCTYCGTRLEVHRSGGAAYTEILESIHERTEQIAGDVEQIRRQNELEQLDREWMIRRESLMVTGKHGSRHVPGRAGALIGAVIVVVFGIFWIGSAASMGAPGFFPLFGLLVVAVALFAGVAQFMKAGEYERAEQEYQQRREQLQREINGRR